MRIVALTTALCALALVAQQPKTRQPDQPQSGYDRSARGTVLRSTTVYVAPDTTSQRITRMIPGREFIIEERSGEWIKIFANTDDQEQREEEIPEFTEDEGAAPKSGWIHAAGAVTPDTPNGDKILYGAATNAEAIAQQPHAPRDAAATAYLLYRRAAQYFPNSPLAEKAAWRSADDRWQIERADQRTLPSASEMDPGARPPLYDAALKRIVKQGSEKYSALAAYDLLDQKLCGDWQGLPKCPRMESELYEKYAAQYPNGPRTAQALFNAVSRQAALVTMYQADDDRKNADRAAQHAKDLNAQLQSRFPQSDYSARSAALIYRIEQGIPNYGNDKD